MGTQDHVRQTPRPDWIRDRRGPSLLLSGRRNWDDSALARRRSAAGKRLPRQTLVIPHHQDLELIHCESIVERRYGEWSMVRVSMSDVDPQTKIVWPEFDPCSASGALVMARIDTLIAQGKLVQPDTVGYHQPD